MVSKNSKNTPTNLIAHRNTPGIFIWLLHPFSEHSLQLPPKVHIYASSLQLPQPFHPGKTRKAIFSLKIFQNCHDPAEWYSFGVHFRIFWPGCTHFRRTRLELTKLLKFINLGKKGKSYADCYTCPSHKLCKLCRHRRHVVHSFRIFSLLNVNQQNWWKFQDFRCISKDSLTQNVSLALCSGKTHPIG